MNNPRLSYLARIGGIIYLLIIMLGIFGHLIVRGSIVTMDPASTYSNILASESLWRLGIIGDLLMQSLDIPLMVIFYLLLRDVSRPLTLLGVAFNVIQTAVLVVNKMTLVTATLLAQQATSIEAFTSEQIKAQVYMLTEMHDQGFGVGLIFFGLACLTYGYLIFQSMHFPKVLGLLIANAGLCYLINSVVMLLAPQYSGDVYLVLVFSLIGELSFALWLLIKRVKPNPTLERIL